MSEPRFKHETDDIQAALSEIIAAWNNGDLSPIVHYYLPETTHFRPGQLLETFDPSPYQAWLEAGGKVSFQVRHSDIKVYGDTAVSTGYFVGTITSEDGTVVHGPWQSSITWVKMEGQWKVVHFHRSFLK